MADICALEGCDEPVATTRPGQKYCCGAHRAKNRDRALAVRRQQVAVGAPGDPSGPAPAPAPASEPSPDAEDLDGESSSAPELPDQTGSPALEMAAQIKEVWGGRVRTRPLAPDLDTADQDHGPAAPLAGSDPGTSGSPRGGGAAVAGPDREDHGGGPPSAAAPDGRRIILALAAVALVILVALGYFVSTLHAPAARPAAPGKPPAAVLPFEEPAQPAVSLDQPTVAGSFPTNGPPETVAVSPDGKSAYLTITGDHPALEVIDIASGQVVDDIPVPGPPYFVGVSPSGEDVYVTYYDRGQDQLVIGTMDTRIGQLDGAIPTGQHAAQGGALTWLFGFAVSPAEPHLLYVPNMNASVVSVLDPEQKQAVAQIPVPVSPHWVALSPDGRFGYVTNHMPGQVTVIDTAQNRAIATIPIGDGMSPHSIAVSPDGKLVEEVNYDGDSLTFIDPATNTVMGTIPTGEGPQSIAFAPDGAHSYVVNEDAKTVSVISSRDRRVTGTVPAGDGASMIAVTPDGTKAVVANKESQNVMVLDIGTPAH